MGIVFNSISHYVAPDGLLDDCSTPVFTLASNVVENILQQTTLPSLSHIITATSGPDQIAPSMGQELRRKYGLADCLTLDLIQGCTGGVTALITASQLAEQGKGAVLVVAADAARQSVSRSSILRNTLRDGAFACVVQGDVNSSKGLINHFSKQYCDLTDIVTIPLGHRTRDLVKELEKNPNELFSDPVRALGFHISNKLTIRMLHRSKNILNDIGQLGSSAEVVISHYPNFRITKSLKRNRAFQHSHFVDLNEEKNCGAATTGIGLSKALSIIQNKKVFIGSFGTGGAVTCGIWQF